MFQNTGKPSAPLNRWLCASAAALAMTVPQQIGAQTTGAAADAERVEVDVITVTANKRAESLTNIAGALNVETGDDLNAQSATGLRDYVGNLPGVSLQSNGSPGFARVVIRGISGVTLNATTATYIDDVAVSASGSQVAGGFLTPDLDPADLERVEVLKGPQGALYGASGPGGLLKYVTRLPDTETFSGGAKEELSSVHHGGTGYSLRAHANVPIATDVAALRISGFYRKDPGFIDNLGTGEKNSNDLVAKGLIGNLLLKPSSDLTIRIGGIIQDLEADGMNAISVDRDTLEPVFGRDDVSTTLRQGNDARFRHVSATISYDLSPDIQFVSATGYSRIANRDRTDLTPDAPLPVLRYYNVATRKFTQELRLMSAENKVLEWMVGLYFTRERSNGSTIFQPMQADGTPDDSFPLFLDFVSHTRYREIAAFGNATYYFTPDFDVTVGLRYSSNRAHFVDRERGLLGNPDDPDTFIDTIGQRQKDEVVNYLATARWRFAENSLLYARAANAYQPGGPRSLPAAVTPPLGFTDSYGPEKLWNYEAGIRTSLLDNRLEINASLYYIDWKDIQGFVQIGDDFLVGATGNAGDAVSKGFEVEINARPTRGLSLGASVGYSKATLERSDPTFGAEVGDALPYAPRWTVSLNGEYEQPLSDDWTAFIGGNYRSMTKHFSNFESRAFLSPREAIPFKGYGVLDLRIGARSPHFDVTLFAKNVTNKFAYTADTTATATGPAFESIVQPRTIGISFSQRY